MTWTCQRVSKGIRCACVNAGRARKCAKCSKARPARKRPKHMKALDLPYEFYIQLNGGEFCGICGADPKPGRKLDRDHEHKADGTPRGLLCWPCNNKMRGWVTLEWLLKAVAYLERTGPDRRIGGVSTTAFNTNEKGPNA